MALWTVLNFQLRNSYESIYSVLGHTKAYKFHPKSDLWIEIVENMLHSTLLCTHGHCLLTQTTKYPLPWGSTMPYTALGPVFSKFSLR